MGSRSLAGPRFFGYDYSASLIASAKKLLDGDFKVSEASINPFIEIEFDFVISHSVFQYFPSNDYAQEVISEMAKALRSNGRIALLDINDALAEPTYHDDRRKNYTNPGEYDEKYKGHPHHFYCKEAVENYLIELGFVNIEFPTHAVPEYSNAQYRFNIVGSKK